MAPKEDLATTLARLGEVLAREVEAWEEKTRGDRARVMEQVSKKLSRAFLSKEERRELRRKERAEERAQRRQRALEEASVPRGIFMLLAAVVLAGLAVGNFVAGRPELWWLVFVSLGVGSGGLRQFSLASQRARLGAGVSPAVSQPNTGGAERHEIDALCDQLLADLKASPDAVRAFVQRPEQTVESLRSTAKALDVRRRQLTAEDAPGHLAALASQRHALTVRRDAAGDPAARAKLDAALRSLDGQQVALQQLVAASERVDGEYTSLLVLLQELRTRVAVARATTSAPQLGGLEQSVQRLNAELEAITESLQATQASPFTAVDEGVAGGVTGDPARQRERG